MSKFAFCGIKGIEFDKSPPSGVRSSLVDRIKRAKNRIIGWLLISKKRAGRGKSPGTSGIGRGLEANSVAGVKGRVRRI